MLGTIAGYMSEMENQGDIVISLPSIGEFVGKAVGHFIAIDNMNPSNKTSITTELVSVSTIRPPLHPLQ